MSTPHTVPVSPGSPSLLRPEVPALRTAIERPQNVDDRDPSKGQYVTLDLDVARAVADLIEYLCIGTTEHKVCDCGAAVYCPRCGVGNAEDWCVHNDLCRSCVGRCIHCAAECA